MGTISNWKHDHPPQETILFIDSIDPDIVLCHVFNVANKHSDQLKEDVIYSICMESTLFGIGL